MINTKQHENRNILASNQLDRMRSLRTVERTITTLSKCIIPLSKKTLCNTSSIFDTTVELHASFLSSSVIVELHIRGPEI